MRAILSVVALAIAGCERTSSLQTEAASAAVDTVTCAHVDGLIDGPHVDDEATARLIAGAIIKPKESPETQHKYELKVRDGGSYWVAFQSVRDRPNMMGGGGLAMRIAKCDGAISSVHWQG